jgi:mRNA interferase RelE/StbE
MPGQATEVYAPRFDRQFSAIPPADRSRIMEAIRQLGRNLDAHNHHRLQGSEFFRLRIGDYRVIYDFEIARNGLRLLSVGHRREIYR